MPGLDTGEARRRLTLLSAGDPSPRPLAAKLVERPRGIGLEQLLDRARGGDVAWDPVRQTGVVFHTLSGLAVSGKAGVTAIGSSPGEAEALLERTARLLAGLSAG